MYAEKRSFLRSLIWAAPLGLGLVAVATLPMGGCFLRPNTVVDRFAGEFRCPKEQIKVDKIDKNTPDMFRASGCNRRATYRCSGDYGEFCERLGQPETIRPEAGAIETNFDAGLAPVEPAQSPPAAK